MEVGRVSSATDVLCTHRSQNKGLGIGVLDLDKPSQIQPL